MQLKENPIGDVVKFLCVLGIGGVLISLPSLMSCNTSKTKQVEAKLNIGAMNRSQQAYQLEFKTFTQSFVDLSVGIKPQSINYNYSIRTTKTAAFHYAIARKKTRNIKSYVGGIFLIPATNAAPKANKDEMLTVAIACEALRPGSITPTAPTLVKGVPTCGSGTRDLSLVQPR